MAEPNYWVVPGGECDDHVTARIHNRRLHQRLYIHTYRPDTSSCGRGPRRISVRVEELGPMVFLASLQPGPAVVSHEGRCAAVRGITTIVCGNYSTPWICDGCAISRWGIRSGYTRSNLGVQRAAPSILGRLFMDSHDDHLLQGENEIESPCPHNTIQIIQC